MAAERVIPPLEAGERQMLSAWLDLQRATLAMKCDGLSDEQLREQAVPPSSLSLLGLVRHMAEVERNWFRPLLAGEEMGGLWAPGPELDPEPAFDDVATADVAASFAAWRAECDRRIAVLAALGHGPHDRGVRAAQRPRRPAARAHRRHHGRLIRAQQAEQ
jgi:uncharacterized damage-inducible protein DinB